MNFGFSELQFKHSIYFKVGLGFGVFFMSLFTLSDLVRREAIFL